MTTDHHTLSDQKLSDHKLSDHKLSDQTQSDHGGDDATLRFRSVLRTFASGVAVVTIADRTGVHGMTASSFSSVSLAPPLCSVSVNKLSLLHERPSRMHTLLSDTGDRFGISILAEGQSAVADFYARRPWASSAEIEMTWSDGCPLVAGALAWFVCRKWAEYDGGDHSIFVGHTLDSGTAAEPGLTPLIHHGSRYHQLGGPLAHTDGPEGDARR
ncbi:flavin reductase family protein [Amycolatopsis rhabdoformis]|uniref:Flavin reductase family protein n=1 Tax=Amycolatopsis rhabdoformis TaxID=1448059 RepID=A0ABZ1IHT4_9PSEU|nr:flavin reductase family protein [Amycolatopsis rhabdoformis]WSE33681.1 flavin reductase family protein [Amycolatopsis rhabdoformis]